MISFNSIQLNSIKIIVIHWKLLSFIDKIYHIYLKNILLLWRFCCSLFTVSLENVRNHDFQCSNLCEWLIKMLLFHSRTAKIYISIFHSLAQFYFTYSQWIIRLWMPSKMDVIHIYDRKNIHHCYFCSHQKLTFCFKVLKFIF